MERKAPGGDNANEPKTTRIGARHAKRVSYRGSDDYVVTQVGAPDTVPFESGADLSGFDRMVIEHAPEEYTVESVGTADPFQPDAAENYTRPFTTAFPEAGRPYDTEPHGYSTFSEIADYDPYGDPGPVRDGYTARQPAITVERVGDASQARGTNRAQGERARSFDMPDAGGGTSIGKDGKPKKRHRRLKVALIAVIAVVVVALGAFFIYTHILDSTLDKSERGSASAVLKPTKFDEPFYMLVMGGDSPEAADVGAGEPTGQRSDVLMLLRVDPKSRVVTMVSIPRDTMYTWPDGTVTKINECYYSGGAEAAVRAVSEITGADISHYVSLSFDNLDEIVDAIGGVDVYVDVPIDQVMEGRRVVLDEGEHHVNGLEALAYARSRKNYSEFQDMNRQSHVRALSQAIIGKVMDRPLLELPGTVLNLAQYVSTDLRSGDLLGLASAFGGSTRGMTVYSGTGPYDGDIFDEYGSMWYCYPNPEGWARLMAVVNAGEDPSGVEY